MVEVDVEVKSTYKGGYVITHIAKVKVQLDYDEKVILDIVQEVLEILSGEFEDVSIEEIEKYVKEISEDEFKRTFEKELVRELKVDYEIKSIKKENEEYEIEVVSNEEFDPDLWEEKKIIDNIEKFKENFKEELVAVIETAFGNAKCNLAEKVSKIIIEKLRKEESEEEETEEEPVEEFRRAIIVASRDFYITLPKSYLKHLYKKFRKVPKWVSFKYYNDGRIVIEPIWSKEEIPKEKLEWFGITKL